MRWSPQQEQALRMIAEFMRDPTRQVFYLAGFAGTGKTTLVREFAANLAGLVLYAAFTGKAAYVLRTKGCEGATTIHSLIYISAQQSRAKLKEMEESLGELLAELHDEFGPDYDVQQNAQVKDLQASIRVEKEAVEKAHFVLNHDSPLKDATVLFLDECSMVDIPIGRDLLSFGTKIVVLGDPFQLPPVFGAGFFTSMNPDFTLTEIHRQAADNPILRMATDIRLGRSLPLGTYGNSRVIMQDKVVLDDVLGCDQMLVGRNKTRQDSNVKLRRLKFFKDKEYQIYPIPGDRVVCLRNDHEAGLLNGQLWEVERAGAVNMTDSLINMRLKPLDSTSEPQSVISHTHYFEKRGDKLQWFSKQDAQEFDYGYALTVHKSQGSQWDDVLIFDESYIFKEYRYQWLYTAVTRAAERVTLVRM